MNYIEELTLRAVQCGKLKSHLKGIGPSRIQQHSYECSNQPTDSLRLLGEGIYEVYKNNPEIKIDEKMQEVLHEMLDGDVFEIYMALRTIFCHMIKESCDDAPFRLNAELFEHLKESLNSHKQELTAYKEWAGLGRENGVWDEVLRVDSIVADLNGQSILNFQRQPVLPQHTTTLHKLSDKIAGIAKLWRKER